MASNNLRILYQNILDNQLDSVAISASSTGAGSTANLKLDAKSLVWRSAASGVSNGTNPLTYTTKANLVVSWSTSTLIGAVVLPFCNLSAAATIRVRCFTGTAPTAGTDSGGVAGQTLVRDTTALLAAPYTTLGLWNWGSLPLGVNSYSYGGGTYARVWFSPVACTSLLIEIVDTANLSQYIEASRLVTGSYWTPKYNTSFGLSLGVKDLSSHQRSESGDLITTRGVRYRSMNFQLNYLDPADRLEFTRILRGSGMPRPMFITLFPDDTDREKEQAYQIWGKLSELSDITHPIFDMYSASVNIEEV
jgi:hypothetical protein